MNNKKFIIVIFLLSIIIFLVSCSTFSEKMCKKYDGTLIDKHTCIIGKDNLTYSYLFSCNKDSLTIKSDINIDNLEMPLTTQCIYMKIVNKDN